MDLTDFIRTKEFTPNTMLALRQLIIDTTHAMQLYKGLALIPAQEQGNVSRVSRYASQIVRVHFLNILEGRLR